MAFTSASGVSQDHHEKARDDFAQTQAAEEQSEGPVARAIEKKTSRLPSDLFLWAAAASIAVSAVLQIRGKRKQSLFVGQWVSPILLLGVYNKIVKVAGSDRTPRS